MRHGSHMTAMNRREGAPTGHDQWPMSLNMRARMHGDGTYVGTCHHATLNASTGARIWDRRGGKVGGNSERLVAQVDVCQSGSSSLRSRELGKMSDPTISIKAMLDAQGTDKGRWYGGLYGVLLSPIRECVRCVVEIGIGTMIPGRPSSMVGVVGAGTYRPGASLRAWRDFFPNADVHGVDVAPDTGIDFRASNYNTSLRFD